MRTLLRYAGTLVLAAHGVVHLLGTAVYFELVEIAEFPYKTTLLGSSVTVGDAGMRVFAMVWLVAAFGFVAAAGALLVEWEHWPLLVGAVAVVSLVLTVLDYTVAYAGIVVNLGILAAVAYSYFT